LGIKVCNPSSSPLLYPTLLFGIGRSGWEGGQDEKQDDARQKAAFVDGLL
jgi:hypothetical protein